jgi:hypothetical protein
MQRSRARRLEEQVRLRRHQSFVGRRAELSVFRSALRAQRTPLRVLYVHGPGGIGKTSLLHEYELLCRESKTPVARLDAHHVEPLPQAFLRELAVAMGQRTRAPSVSTLFRRPGRRVLLIDTFETLAPLERWLTDAFLPELPAATLIVLAGRNPPLVRWLSDPGWHDLIRILPLGNLTPSESRAFLRKHQVTPSRHRAALEFAHGHPLALSLLASHLVRNGELAFDPADAPDVIRALLEALLKDVRDPMRRAALDACAVVRTVTESLLGEMLDVTDAHELFLWLQSLPFMEPSPQGLFPHDLAREVLLADLRWRNPERHATLLRRAQAHYLAGLRSASSDSVRLATDITFLSQKNPAIQRLSEWTHAAELTTEPVAEEDVPHILRIVARHEGAESARLAARWLEVQRENFFVMRDEKGRPAGFTSVLSLGDAARQDIHADPCAKAAWKYLRQEVGLRPGERATLVRFAMARDTYQEPSTVMTLCSALSVRHILTTPRLVYLLRVFADMQRWEAFYAQVDGRRVREAEFEVEGRRFGVLGIDFREFPPGEWIDRILRRAAAASTGAPPLLAPPRPLDRGAFAQAVRDALRELMDPHALARNPLLQSRLVHERTVGSGDRAAGVSALQALIREAVASLEMLPRHDHYYRALARTYLNPAPRQEDAAEDLGLPFRTYRDHLVKGIATLTERLWERELGRV